MSLPLDDRGVNHFLYPFLAWEALTDTPQVKESSGMWKLKPSMGLEPIPSGWKPETLPLHHEGISVPGRT